VGSPKKKKPTTTARSQRFLTDWTHNVKNDVFAQEFLDLPTTNDPRLPESEASELLHAMTSKCHDKRHSRWERGFTRAMEGLFARRVKCCHIRRQFLVAIPFRRN